MRRLVLLVCVVLALPIVAEGQRAVTVRADNDAFNFWQYPWQRPDEEYTSGVRLTLDFDGAAPWVKRFAKALGACAVEQRNCASHSWAFGQDIYTAVRPKNVAVATPGGRPDAGVLWVSSATRLARANRLSEIGWTIGATGAVSLAEQTQQFFHDLAPAYNRPIEWRNTVPGEPTFALRWDERRLRRFTSADVTPHAGASLGTLLTEMRAGVGARLGRDLAHPWAVAARHDGVAVWLEGDATVRGVVRNEVLSGAFFRTSAHVPLRHIVPELQLGIHGRAGAFEAAYVVHQTGAEYRTRSTAHQWSTLQLRWTPAR